MHSPPISELLPTAKCSCADSEKKRGMKHLYVLPLYSPLPGRAPNSLHNLSHSETTQEFGNARIHKGLADKFFDYVLVYL